MSVPVPLDELPRTIDRFGTRAYLLSVATDGRPRVNAVDVAWQRNLLTMGAGRRTAESVAANPAVALLWPARGRDQYALIVDGSAEVHAGADATVVLVTPEKAVLHVTRRGGHASAASGAA